ncbi:MAG: class 1 fructose-bisphosphatase [Candidatus Binatia bacterium]
MKEAVVMKDASVSLSANLEAQQQSDGMDPALTRVLVDLAGSAAVISGEVNKAALINILGATGTTNVHGEEVKKLDLHSNELIVKCFRDTACVCGMASEEVDRVIEPSPRGCDSEYVVLFDPLDGSSNIDVNVSIGTIFSVYRRVTSLGSPAVQEDFLRPGNEQVAAGYFLYGSSTMLVYTVGSGVNGFTMDPSNGEFLLTHPDIRIPERGKIYSCNEGNTWTWDQATRDYVASLKDEDAGPGRPYSARYVGSLVADFHRNLIKGGIFLYPAGRKRADEKPRGKLRLMYEANPMAFVVEQAGGVATDGRSRILDLVPSGIHDRVALIIGSRRDVEEYQSFVATRGTSSLEVGAG